MPSPRLPHVRPLTNRQPFRLSPPQTIVISFAVMILAGAALLCLPAASRSGESVGFLDALFTATSANCVTGLIVVNTLQHWTLFGQVVILVLIQLGGLGLVAILTVGMVVFRRRVSLRNRLIIQAAFNQDGVGGMVRLVRLVILSTALIEGIGIVLLTLGFYFSAPAALGASISFGQALWQGVFHSISAFCNAGFDIVGTDSLTPYAANPFINLVIMALIVAGGLGFVVLGELAARPKGPRARGRLRFKLRHLSLHAKLALWVTGLLIAAGFLLFLLLEWNNPLTLGGLPPGEKTLAALFQSVTLRTCGFNTISQGGLSDTSKFTSGLLMMVGGSPAGTAGGIKTVTLGVIAASVFSVLRGRPKIEVGGRSLPLVMLQKALAVTATLTAVVLLATLLLHFTEADLPHTFIDLFFESASAAGTVGVSAGITPDLSAGGKIIIMLCMYVGRLSPVTVAVALNMRLGRGSADISYPDERVIIG